MFIISQHFQFGAAGQGNAIYKKKTPSQKKTVINHFECKVGIFFLLIFSYILSDSLSRDELSDAPWEIVRLIPHSTHILCADVHI